MKTLRRLSMMIAVAMMMMFVFVGALFAQSGVPQDVPGASAQYAVPASVLYPVVDANSGVIVAWKVDSVNAVTATFQSGLCVDYIKSKSTVSASAPGHASVMDSPYEDWSRMQVNTGTVAFNGPAATIYVGKCNPMVEITATVTASPTLNVRKGPGTNFSKLGTIALGTKFYAQARNATGTWVYGITPTHMGAWYSAEFLAITNVMSLPIAEVLSPKPVAR